MSSDTCWRFREARQALGLTVPATADLLQISERTVRGWESGATRIPYAAFKLLRVLKGGRLLEHPHWAHFHVRGPVLWTPEGHALQAGDLAWLSLLVRRARAFSARMVADRSQGDTGQAQAATAAAPTAPASRPAGQQEEGAIEAPGSGAAAGLVYSSTTQTLGGPKSASTAKNKGFAGALVEAAPAPLTGLWPARGPAGAPGKHRLRAALRAAGGGA